MGKLFVVFRPQIIFAGISIARHTTAIGHVVWGGVAECLKYCIWAFLLDLEHNLSLTRIAIPMIFVAAEVLEALHLCTQSFTLAHMVLRTVLIKRIIAATDVIAEDAVVQPRRADQPSYDFVYLVVIPLATHACPPAKRHAPTFKMLTNNRRIDKVSCRVCRQNRIGLVAKVPMMIYVFTALIGKDPLAGSDTIGAQVFAVGSALQSYQIARNLLYGVLGFARGRVVGENSVPIAFKGKESSPIARLYVIVTASNRHKCHHLTTRSNRRFQDSPPTAVALEMIATAVHEIHLSWLIKTCLRLQ